MSVLGTQAAGDTPGFVLEASITTLDYGSVMYLTSTMEVAPTNGTTRGPVVGVAKDQFPPVADTAGIAFIEETDLVTDVGPKVFGGSTIGRKVPIEMEEIAWVLVDLPPASSDRTIVPGDSLVPSLATGSFGCEAITPGDFSTPDEAEIRAGFVEERRVFALALSNIHQEHRTGSGRPGLGINNADTLTDTAARDLGWVLAKILR